MAAWRGTSEQALVANRNISPVSMRHGITHVFNSWRTRCRLLGDQMALSGSRTNPQLTGARFLLKPGRKYEEAAKAFQPQMTGLQKRE